MDLFHQDPDDTYRAYQKFRNCNEHERAYRCLERLLNQFPEDMKLLEEMLGLTLSAMRAPNLARPWVMRRIALDSFWRDYALLSEIDAVTGNLPSAKENLAIATKLQKRQRSQPDFHNEAGKVLARAIFSASRNKLDGSRAFRLAAPANLRSIKTLRR